MKKTCFPALFLAFLLAAPTVGVSAADSAPVLSYSPNAQGSQQTLRLDGLPSGCYGVELTLSTSGGKNYSFDFDDALSKDGNFSVDKQSSGTITLYVAAGESPLVSGDSLSLGRLSADGDFSIRSVSGKLLDRSMQEHAYSSLSLQKYSASSGGSGSSARYAIEILSAEGGSVESSPSKASKGAKVTLTAIPDSGYSLKSMAVTDADENEIRLAKQSSQRFTFDMPASDVFVKPVFQSGAQPDLLPFRDVPESEWFYSAVQYVYRHGMMSGTDAALFSPNVTTTRGMIVTILYRLEGSPSVSAAPFLDVPASQYYANPVAWASANGIVSGYGGGAFGPDDTITREQMASILYRYAQYKNYDVSASADLSGYADSGKISPYAVRALQWANANHLVSGTTPTTLAPGGSATRAQVASILMRFCENIAE